MTSQNLVVDLLLEHAHSEKHREIFEEFVENSHNNNGKPWKSSNILRVKTKPSTSYEISHFFSTFFFIFIFFLSLFCYFSSFFFIFSLFLDFSSFFHFCIFFIYFFFLSSVFHHFSHVLHFS